MRRDGPEHWFQSYLDQTCDIHVQIARDFINYVSISLSHKKTSKHNSLILSINVFFTSGTF